jgi:hypothetical protein
MERAEHWMKRCTDAGIKVVSDWPETIRKYSGEANPMHKPRRELGEIAARNLLQISNAGALWLLLPERSTVGAWVELGWAMCMQAISVQAMEAGLIKTPRPYVICSGTERSIYSCIIEDCFKTDEEAFALLTAVPPKKETAASQG